MIDIAGFVFTYYMTESLQSFLLGNVSDFIWYSKVTAYIVCFDVDHGRNSCYNLKVIILKCTQFSYVFLLQLQVSPAYMAIKTISAL